MAVDVQGGTGMSILDVQGLVKSFGRRRVVDGVSFRVERGEIVGLLGPNGAGKTTSFRMTCGLVEPDKGTVLLGDRDVTRWPFFRRAREGGMGYLPQQTSVFAKLTTEQNLLAMMELLGMGRRERRDRCEELLERFRITHIRRSKAGKLSGGEKRRLEIARCLVSNPEIIMLDEPFAGIDPVTVQSIQGVIRELRDHGISILITDHAAREILQITDRTYVISDGRVLCSGSAEEIVAHDEVKRKYLGEIDSFAPSTPNPPRPHFASRSGRDSDEVSSYATERSSTSPTAPAGKTRSTARPFPFPRRRRTDVDP
ncbi:MAG TPA: LPS export ABC transporter ATP-binding protein [Pirellulaceae bacterium]|nr:LPS export ABC transporter ATP-binding protein [Pirellulaceae bacterium]